MMLSSGYIQLKICKAFCQTPRNYFDFDDEIWFENRSLHALGINFVTKKMKETSKAKSLSQLYKSWSPKLSNIMAISVHSNEHSLISCNKRPSEDQLSDGMSQTLSREALILVPHLHTSRTRKVILTVQNFPINQRRTDEYFQLQGMLSSCNIGSANVVLKENWE